MSTSLLSGFLTKRQFAVATVTLSMAGGERVVGVPLGYWNPSF
jgi:hypothetical protein